MRKIHDRSVTSSRVVTSPPGKKNKINVNVLDDGMHSRESPTPDVHVGSYPGLTPPTPPPPASASIHNRARHEDLSSSRLRSQRAV